MSGQTQELQLAGRYFSAVKKFGVITLVSSSVAAVAFYFGVYQRRRDMFQAYRESLTPARLGELEERMQKFGLMMGPLPPFYELAAFKKVLDGGAVPPKVITFESEISALPKETQTLAREAREEYLRERFPKSLACMNLMKAELEKSGVTYVDPAVLKESPEFMASTEEMRAEMSKADMRGINAGLKKKLSEVTGQAF